MTVTKAHIIVGKCKCGRKARWYCTVCQGEFCTKCTNKHVHEDEVWMTNMVMIVH